jgi:hypothetical protein
MTAETRNDYLLPDGWVPARGSRVVLIGTKDDPEPPPGVYRLIEKAPLGWWAQPTDDVARAWATEHPGAVVQGCLQVPGRRLVPPGSKRRVSDR